MLNEVNHWMQMYTEEIKKLREEFLQESQNLLLTEVISDFSQLLFCVEEMPDEFKLEHLYPQCDSSEGLV